MCGSAVTGSKLQMSQRIWSRGLRKNGVSGIPVILPLLGNKKPLLWSSLACRNKFDIQRQILKILFYLPIFSQYYDNIISTSTSCLILLNNLGLKVPLGPLLWPPAPLPPLFLPGLTHKPCCWLDPSSIALGLPCTPARCLSALVCLSISCTALLSTISVSTRTYLEQGTLITTWF